MVIKGKNPVLDLRASLGITQMLPRNTGMKGDIIGTGAKDRAPLRGPIKGSTMVAVAQDTAGTGADYSVSRHRFLVLSVCSVMDGLNQNMKSKLIRIRFLKPSRSLETLRTFS